MDLVSQIFRYISMSSYHIYVVYFPMFPFEVSVIYFSISILFCILLSTGKPGKPGKMGRHFPVREKSGNFVQGKVRENHTKYWKTRGI